MDSLQKVAIASAVKNVAAAKRDIKPGTYHPEPMLVLVTVDEIRKGEDHDQKVTAELPVKALLMKVFSEMAPQHVDAWLRRAANDDLEIAPDRAKRVEESWDKLAATTTKNVSGKTTTHGVSAKLIDSVDIANLVEFSEAI